MEKLINIQSALKCNKGQTNSFGNYKYRSCEDILEAVKPLLQKEGVSLLITDEMVQVGERIYVKATATISDGQDGSVHNVSVSAYAREPLLKKGMDESQITGATSSYARKYALNGLLCIDDTKDADTEAPPEATGASQKPVSQAQHSTSPKLTERQLNAILSLTAKLQWDDQEVENIITIKFDKKKPEDLSIKEASELITLLNDRIKNK